MSSTLTFGVELEFALALLDEGQFDPEPELPQPATLLPRSSNPTYHVAYDGVMNKVFDLIANKMIAAGVPTRALYRGTTAPDSVVGSSSGGSSQVQDDGIGWIPSHRKRHGRSSPSQSLEQVVDDRNEDGGIEDTNENDEVENTSESDEQIGASREAGTASMDEFGRQWMVTEDMTVGFSTPGDYTWRSMEVQSPPYIFCEDSLQAVILACQAITSEFRIETNATTGLHVHVGDGADGYPLQTVKKLMAFLWTFEPQIDQLHPNRRARLSDYEGPTWYESLRRGSRLCIKRSIDGSFPLKILDGLKMIFEAANISALANLMEPEQCKSAYKVSHLIYKTTLKRTVEFRQHEGTLDGTRVTEWIKTVVSLMEWIIDVDTTSLMEFLDAAAGYEDTCWDDETNAPYDIINLFNDIGLAEQATYWDQAIPKSTRSRPTKYYNYPRKPPPRQPRITENENPTLGEPINDSDQRDLDSGMLQAGQSSTPPRQTCQRTSAFWTRIFTGQGESQWESAGSTEMPQAGAPGKATKESGRDPNDPVW